MIIVLHLAIGFVLGLGGVFCYKVWRDMREYISNVEHDLSETDQSTQRYVEKLTSDLERRIGVLEVNERGHA